jgi:hypothetical protein
VRSQLRFCQLVVALAQDKKMTTLGELQDELRRDASFAQECEGASEICGHMDLASRILDTLRKAGITNRDLTLVQVADELTEAIVDCD